MLRVPGLGPKKVKELIDQLGIRSLGELEYAGHENRLVTLPGFGKKSQENILRGIEHLKKFQGRFLFGEAYPQARALLEEIQKHPQTLRADIAGSLRRRKEIVKDIDLVAESRKPEALMDLFTSLPLVEQVTAKGPTKAAVLLKTGIQADLRVVGPGGLPLCPAPLYGQQGTPYRPAGLWPMTRALRSMSTACSKKKSRSPAAMRPNFTAIWDWPISRPSCGRIGEKSRPPREKSSRAWWRRKTSGGPFIFTRT